MTAPVWTDQQILNQLISGSQWSGAQITYSFPTSSAFTYTGGGEGSGFQALTTVQIEYATLALNDWDDLISPDFALASGSTDIEFGTSTIGVDYAHAYYPTTGSVWFNNAFSDLATPALGDYGFMTYIHEIGHALGLDHMGDYNGSANQPFSYQDSTVLSVMSYFGPDHYDGEGQVMWADWSRGGITYSAQTPMLNDIMAIQSVYGIETTTRTGDTVYGFQSNVTGNTAVIYDFTRNANPIFTIFDSGGIDTINLSGFSTSSTITLVAGTYSSCNDMTYNIAIAYTAVIENATGGSGSDSITGNSVQNYLSGLGGVDMLIGGNGDDTLDGGGGSDTAVYTGARANYQVTENSDGSFSIAALTGSEGTDKLIGVEKLQFSDVTIALSHQPTLANPLANQSVLEDAQFTLTIPGNVFQDTDGDVLSYTASLANGSALPAWLSFNATTRVFSGKPSNSDVGTVSVKVTASDGVSSTSDTFDIVVGNTNDTPTLAHAIADQTTVANGSFSLALAENTFQDVDVGDTLTYTAALESGAALPSWLHFNASTRTFTGTPLNGDTGTLSVKVTASDGIASASDVFKISIASDNSPPVVALALIDQTATEDGIFTFLVPEAAFTDPEADTLTYTASLANGAALPSWLTFNTATRTFSGTPLNENVGTLAVMVTANDGHSSTSDTFNLAVANTNDAPILVTAIADRSAKEDTAFSFTVPVSTFTDIDVGDTLSYTASLSDGTPLPSWLSFNAATKTFSGTPHADSLGAISVKVTASDGTASVSDIFQLTVNHTNHLPSLVQPVTDQTATEDTPFSFSIPGNSFTDVDGDTLTYTAKLESGAALPSWLSFDPSTRTFSGTPVQGSDGTLAIKVTASDGLSAVSGTFNLSIHSTNTAPFAFDDTWTMNESDLASVNVLANDFDNEGDLLQLVSATVISGSGMATIQQNGTLGIQYIGTDLDPGKTAVISISYEVIDGASSDVATLTVTVNGQAEPGDPIIGNDKANKLTGTQFGELIMGFGGKDSISGNAGADFIEGGNGNDRLAGGSGADTFYFASRSGKDVITDFQGKSGDVIDLSDVNQILNFRDLKRNHVFDTSGGDLMITIDAKNSVLLENIHRSDLKADDFHF